MKPRSAVGLLCPSDPDHGPLLELEGRLRCIHHDHDGRPSTAPGGARPMTRSVFTLDEALSPTPREAPEAKGQAGNLIGTASDVSPAAGRLFPE